MALLRTVSRFYGCYRGAQPVCSAFQTSVTSHPKVSNFQWRSLPVVSCSTLAPSTDISVLYKHGRPVLELPLPSRQEKCQFFLRPMLWTIGDFIQEIQKEDPGVSTAALLTTDGTKIASTTPMDTILNKDFQLCMNGVTYSVHAASRGSGMGLSKGLEAVTSEQLMSSTDMKNLVHVLHTALCLPEHHLMKEKQLLQKQDVLKQELMHLEQMKYQLDVRAERSSSQALWGGLALLSVQGGALAWLTWWVYSWDIMEPVTYFITYSTSIGVYAYYVITKQDYVYPDAKDRQFLNYFYKAAKTQQFDVQKYNLLKDQLASVEEDLRRLRNPNQLRLAVE